MSKGINKCRRLVVKRKINHRKDPIANILQIVAISSIFFGLLILIVFFFALTKKFSVLNGELDMAATGQVGDFIGGFVGAIWSLTGILLFYVTLRLQKNELQLQRKEIRLQRKEMKDGRIEFQVNRLTNVVFKQIELSESAISNFTIQEIVKVDGATTWTKVSGQHALQYLVSILKKTESVVNKKYLSEEEKTLAIQSNFLIYSEFFEKNDKELNALFSRIKNYITVVSNTLHQKNIPIEKLVELKMIYFTNVSSDFFIFIEAFSMYVDQVIDHQERTKKNEIFSPLKSLSSNLKLIKSYKTEPITKESIDKFQKNASLYNDTILT